MPPTGTTDGTCTKSDYCFEDKHPSIETAKKHHTMTKKILSLLLTMTAAMALQAQDVQEPALPQPAPQTAEAPQTYLFGYFSYSTILKSMTEYQKVQQDIATLRKQYDAEAKRVEDEFNRKYEDFLEGQRDFAPSILKKRQNELQDLLDRNVAFKQEAQRLLQQAEQDALAPLKARVSEAMGQLAAIRGYAFIINTDGDTLPWVDPTRGEDINATLLSILQAK